MFLILLRKLFLLFLRTGMMFGKHERKCTLILYDIKRRSNHMIEEKWGGLRVFM